MFILALSPNCTKMLRNKNKAREEKELEGKIKTNRKYQKNVGAKSDKQVLSDLAGQRNLNLEPGLGERVAGSRL